MDDGGVINLLKGLVLDGVEKAKSGHPGGAMSSMDFAYLLFTEFLNFNPDDSEWQGRDRFVLSAGHESMLLYSLLHGIGWLPKDELKRFRQLGSQTPGHPENTVTKGVECTTGPLGQGGAMSVGFAIGSKHLEARVSSLFTAKTWALLGDGCMQEGVTLGAASLAGHLKLNNLIWYYDRNKQQISGNIDRAVSDDIAQIFKGFGWKVYEVDGHNHLQLRAVMQKASQAKEAPTLIVGNTVMAKGSATQEGKHTTHGAPFGEQELKATKKHLGLPEDQSFYWPDNANDFFQRRFAELRKQAALWNEQATAEGLNQKLNGYTQPDIQALPVPEWPEKIATRAVFGKLLEAWAPSLPSLLGGSADLEPSNSTGAFAKLVGDFQADNPQGRNLAYGVREFPMMAISNGLSLMGPFIPFDATFLVFSDYARAAIRLAAIQKIQVIHELTHDSFYVGEDGPTHQPIEHIVSLRSMPDVYVMRPADGAETAALLKVALSRKIVSCMCLTRQNLPTLSAVGAAEKGAWVVRESKNNLVLYATGSEVALALEVAEVLDARVISVPCWELLFEQPQNYIDDMMSEGCDYRVSIEAGSTLGWEKFTGRSGLQIGVDHYGESAPAGELASHYGFTREMIVSRIEQYMK